MQQAAMRAARHAAKEGRAVMPHARAAGTQPSPPTLAAGRQGLHRPRQILQTMRLLLRRGSWSAYSDMLRITKSYSIAPHAAAAPGAAHVLFPG